MHRNICPLLFYSCQPCGLVQDTHPPEKRAETKLKKPKLIDYRLQLW
jgi:hypothetical protein